MEEGGEYTSVAFGEAGETLQLGTFGRKTALTRQAIINDDLGIFSRIPRMFAAAAAMTEGNLVWALITGNPVMADGVALFHASHNNLAGAGAAPDVASLSAMRKAIRMQKSLGGNEMNLAASLILAPPSLETGLEQLLAPLARYLPATTDEVNPFAGKFETVIESRLETASATAWYGMVSPNTIDTIEVAYLNGQQGLYTESRVGFDVDGMEMKARLDIGASVIDFRGFYKNPG
ncbi:phage major capsid protein [Elstera litoralis]